VTTEITDVSDGWKWAPACGLTILAVLLAKGFCPWIGMWVLVLGLFVAAKWISLHPFLLSAKPVRGGRLLAYLLLWPGMDARAFCAKGFAPDPRIGEWVAAVAKTATGAAMLWVGVRLIGTKHPLLSGWAGMIAMVLLVHFGTFQLLSLFWRARHVNARPIMQSPATATSLGRFWSRGWNTAFTDLMHHHLFKTLSRSLGPSAGVLMIFVVSGLLHELVISVPARTGYGLPTFYFITQGLGLLFERSHFGRELGLGSGWKGWCFVALIAGVPAFWLFPPAFVYNVILPMLHAIGAT
jgi:hypothetical protein